GRPPGVAAATPDRLRPLITATGVPDSIHRSHADSGVTPRASSAKKGRHDACAALPIVAAWEPDGSTVMTWTGALFSMLKRCADLSAHAPVSASFRGNVGRVLTLPGQQFIKRRAHLARKGAGPSEPGLLLPDLLGVRRPGRTQAPQGPHLDLPGLRVRRGPTTTTPPPTSWSPPVPGATPALP